MHAGKMQKQILSLRLPHEPVGLMGPQNAPFRNTGSEGAANGCTRWRRYLRRTRRTGRVGHTL